MAIVPYAGASVVSVECGTLVLKVTIGFVCVRTILQLVSMQLMSATNDVNL